MAAFLNKLPLCKFTKALNIWTAGKALIVFTVCAWIWLLVTKPSFRLCEHQNAQIEANDAHHLSNSTPTYLSRSAARIRINLVCIRDVGGLDKDLINVLSVVLAALFTGLLWRSTENLVRAARIQSDDLKRTTEASQLSAKAALDRPWLVIEGLQFNRQDWEAGQAELIARFHITNYGKAPAFVQSSHIAYFLSQQPFRTVEQIASQMPHLIREFPTEAALDAFVGKFAKAPLIADEGDGGQIIHAPKLPVIAHSVIGPGQSTRTFFLQAAPKLEGSDPGIAVETLLPQFIMGKITYVMPGDRIEVLRFCYQANRRYSSFDPFLGKPYNERQSQPQPADV